MSGAFDDSGQHFKLSQYVRRPAEIHGCRTCICNPEGIAASRLREGGRRCLGGMLSLQEPGLMLLTGITQINEAFASQFAYCVEQLDIPIEKINIK